MPLVGMHIVAMYDVYSSFSLPHVVVLVNVRRLLLIYLVLARSHVRIALSSFLVHLGQQITTPQRKTPHPL